MTLPAYTGSMNQSATYWAPGASDGFGSVSFAAPVLITCRWQDRAELFRVGGQELTSEAVVYPDRVLEHKGMLALDDFTGTADPETLANAREIRGVQMSPALSANEQLNKVFL